MRRVILALDSGTSLVKAVAFTEAGDVIATASRPNQVQFGPGGAAEQDMARTWADAAAVLAEVVAKLDDIEPVALAVTGQGDGTWLVDAEDEPVGPALVWLDSRSVGIVEHLRENGAGQAAFAFTGTGLAACQQAPQLLWLQRHRPETMARANAALHCKDWLYLNLTGVRATDPAEASFTFGDWRTRGYRDEVLRALGLLRLRNLLPLIQDGTGEWEPLARPAAALTGLPAGMPVVLGYLDTVCAALGAGIYGAGGDAGVSILGSTAMHARLVTDVDHVTPSPAMTGYCKPFPVPGHTLQAQTSMAATLNMDWLAGIVEQAARLGGQNETLSRHQVLHRLDAAVASAKPAAALYHPFISSAGERGPFTDGHARASLIGLDQDAGLPEVARGIYEGMALAARDCYAALGGVPDEVRLTGGAARSAPMRAILAACLDRPVSGAAQDEAGAAGAAMIAAVSIGQYRDMAACAAEWVAPRHTEPDLPDPKLARIYDGLFPLYRESYGAMPSLWRRLESVREAYHAS